MFGKYFFAQNPPQNKTCQLVFSDRVGFFRPSWFFQTTSWFFQTTSWFSQTASWFFQTTSWFFQTTIHAFCLIINILARL